MSGPALILRRAQPRKSGESKPHDYDVLDGDHDVGRIYLVHANRAETWFWGISFQITKRKSYGYVHTLEEAEAAFRAEYEKVADGALGCFLGQSKRPQRAVFSRTAATWVEHRPARSQASFSRSAKGLSLCQRFARFGFATGRFPDPVGAGRFLAF